MQAIQEAIQLIGKLTQAEKAQVLQWVAQDLGQTFPGIERREGVLSGSACVVRTRIPVWLLVQARKSGTSDAAILGAYPSLRAEDIANAWNYYYSHRQEIDKAILENEAA